MVLFKVKFTGQKNNEQIHLKRHEAAKALLKDSIPKRPASSVDPLSKAEFIQFRNMLDLYFSSLPLYVETEGSPTLTEFCTKHDAKPTELIIDNFKEKATKEQLQQLDLPVLILSTELDNVVAVDVLFQKPPDLDTLMKITGETVLRA